MVVMRLGGKLVHSATGAEDYSVQCKTTDKVCSRNRFHVVDSESRAVPKEAAIPEEKKGQELISLLEDDAFRIIRQMGLLCADKVEYAAMKTCTCLQRQFSPAGEKFEWQHPLYTVQQKKTESLAELAVRLHMLAIPSWKAKKRLKWFIINLLMVLHLLPSN